MLTLVSSLQMLSDCGHLPFVDGMWLRGESTMSMLFYSSSAWIFPLGSLVSIINVPRHDTLIMAPVKVILSGIRACMISVKGGCITWVIWMDHLHSRESLVERDLTPMGEKDVQIKQRDSKSQVMGISYQGSLASMWSWKCQEIDFSLTTPCLSMTLEGPQVLLLVIYFWDKLYHNSVVTR